jgi:Protein of unknown function (DUF3102)
MPFGTDTTNVIPLIRPTPETDEVLAAFLADLADQVRSHSRSCTTSVIAIGKVLMQAKQRLAHGRFTSWVRAECEFTLRSAQNYIRAAELASRAGEIVSLLTPAALYRLSAPGTPVEVISHVLEALHRGLVPTEPEILLLIASFSTGGEETEAARAEVTDDETAVELARKLHSRLGDEMVSKLIGSRWSNLRKHLRNALERSSCAANPLDQRRTGAPRASAANHSDQRSCALTIAVI